MTTFSKLTGSEREALDRRYDHAKARYGITWTDYCALAREEHRLQRWAEEECNGTIQRDEETGKCFRYWPDHPTMRPVPTPDRETGSLKRCEEIAARYGLKFYHQGDPRGCQVHVYRESDLQGSDIRSIYPTQAHAIYF